MRVFRCGVLALGAWLALAAPAYAVTDGEEVSPTIPQYQSPKGAPRCFKLCNTKTTASDCGPIYIGELHADHAIIKVESAVNAGSACTFDDWGVYESRTNATPSATNTFGALCAIDDDTSTSVTGATAGSECKIFGPTLPWIFIDAGTLGTCSNFTVIGCFWPESK